jgi:hypothetical protein
VSVHAKAIVAREAGCPRREGVWLSADGPHQLQAVTLQDGLPAVSDHELAAAALPRRPRGSGTCP